MYVSNRKNGYKVIRKLKTKPVVILMNRYGAEFRTTIDKLAANGYREIKSRPANF